MSVIMLFVDGVGLGDEASDNPWFALPTPHLDRLLGGRSLTRRAVGRPAESTLLLATDAKLGVAGLPQSATGQATIFTSRNAPAAMGRHLSGLPFRRLREWVQRDNVYLQFEGWGRRATFLNAYSEEYFNLPTTRRGWVSVSTAAIQSAREPLRMMGDLRAGRAVYHDLTRRTLAERRPDIREISPEEAAHHALATAWDYDLAVHEFFLSDLAGHRLDTELMTWVVNTYDRFLGELIRQKREDDVVVLVSDHGNSEDFRVKTHTMNPVPTLIVGPSRLLDAIESDGWDLTAIAPLLIRMAEGVNEEGERT